jgi:hypothetical protein
MVRPAEPPAPPAPRLPRGSGAAVPCASLLCVRSCRDPRPRRALAAGAGNHTDSCRGRRRPPGPLSTNVAAKGKVNNRGKLCGDSAPTPSPRSEGETGAGRGRARHAPSPSERMPIGSAGGTYGSRHISHHQSAMARRVLPQNIVNSTTYRMPRGPRGTSTEHRAPRWGDRPLGARASRPLVRPACPRYYDTGVPVVSAAIQRGHSGCPAPPDRHGDGRRARFAPASGCSRPTQTTTERGHFAARSMTSCTRSKRPSRTPRCATTWPRGCGRACRARSVDAPAGFPARAPRASIMAECPGPCSRFSEDLHGASSLQSTSRLPPPRRAVHRPRVPCTPPAGARA